MALTPTWAKDRLLRAAAAAASLASPTYSWWGTCSSGLSRACGDFVEVCTPSSVLSTNGAGARARQVPTKASPGQWPSPTWGE